MPTPDPERLGGLGWTRRTRGALSREERRRMLAAMARTQAEMLAGRIKLALGRLPAGAEKLDLADFRPPDSALAAAAEDACAEQSPAIAGHSHRTWVFGSALAALDATPLDPELFYLGALLHDFGIESPVAGEDFTLRSADRAITCGRAAGLEAASADLVGDAITVHATPGITAQDDGALGCYIQAGATADLIGVRLWDLPKTFVAGTIERHPRRGVRSAIKGNIRAEARAVPEGRFALLARYGFLVAVKLAPIRE
jgi:hypothetical protein